jgi:hypothetical protein
MIYFLPFAPELKHFPVNVDRGILQGGFAIYAHWFAWRIWH